MLGLQVTAPGYLVVKLIVVLFEDPDCFRVGHMAEVGVEHMVEAVQKALVNELVKEVHFLRRILQDITDDVLEHVFSELHVVREIRKAELGLDHPELRRMARSIGQFRTEGRTKSIDVAEGKGIGLDVELAADGQVDGLAEKVLGIIDLSILCHREFTEGKSRNLEHLARTLCIAPGDDGRMHIDKASLLEKSVDRIGDQRTDTEYRCKCVRADSEMGDRAEIFKRVAFFLQRIIGR